MKLNLFNIGEKQREIHRNPFPSDQEEHHDLG